MKQLATRLGSKTALFVLAALTTMATTIAVEVTANQAKIESPTVLATVAPSIPLVVVLSLASLMFFGHRQWKQTVVLFALAAMVVFVWNGAASWMFFWNVFRLGISSPWLPLSKWGYSIAVGGTLSSASLLLSLICLRKLILACRNFRNPASTRAQSTN